MHPVPDGVDADRADLRTIAVDTATLAAEMVRRARVDGFATTTKSTDTDMVTDLDHASDRLIIETLSALRPDDAILTEESGATTGTTGLTWIVDPIDGTTNFVYDLGPYAVSIAVVAGDDVPLAGAIVDIERGACFSASLGGGATLDGVPIAVRPAPPLAQALVATGFAYAPERRTAQATVVAALIARVRDIRRRGAASADLCAVAAGRVDAYYEAGLGPWDLAAGRIIATEAGARVELVEASAHPLSVVAAHPELFGPLMELLVEVGADRL